MNSFVARRSGKIATGLAIFPPPTKPSPTFGRGSLHPGSFLALKLSRFRE